MAATDLPFLSLTDLRRLYQQRALSPVEVTRACLEQIERLNPTLNALLTVTAEMALASARAAEERWGRGEPVPPLLGAPMTLKDLIDTAGVRTTYGSALTERHVPTTDATVVHRLKSAGAVLLGKAALHEWAFGVTNDNPHFGPTRNPWDPTRIPGGSSGGSAVALAAGMGAGSVGTDTGGSIRIPAALCGVVGLKPTFGRISRAGVYPLAWSLDHVGPMARTVADVALLLEVMAGPDPADPTTVGLPPLTRPALETSGDLRGLRLGRPEGAPWDDVEPAVAAAFAQALRTLTDLGATIQPVSLPDADLIAATNPLIIMAEAATVHWDRLRADPDAYGPDVRTRLEAGATILAADYLRAQQARRRLIAAMRALFTTVDLLVLPTTPAAAPPIGARAIALPSGPVETRLALTRFTNLFNLTGLPALSVPAGFTPDGRPVGLQIVGPADSEAMVLRVGHLYSQATPWSGRRPPLA